MKYEYILDSVVKKLMLVFFLLLAWCSRSLSLQILVYKIYFLLYCSMDEKMYEFYDEISTICCCITRPSCLISVNINKRTDFMVTLTTRISKKDINSITSFNIILLQCFIFQSNSTNRNSTNLVRFKPFKYLGFHITNSIIRNYINLNFCSNCCNILFEFVFFKAILSSIYPIGAVSDLRKFAFFYFTWNK